MAGCESYIPIMSSTSTITDLLDPAAPAVLDVPYEAPIDALQREIDTLREQLTESQRLATVGTIVAAVIALWRGSRNSARLGLAAGVFMAVMTMVCPFAGHTPVGWWTWVQTGLSLSVMATSAALLRFRPAEGAGS